MIPLISSQCYGPLQICHLPRLWWKASLNAAGRLAEDYPECTPVLDSMVLDLLGLDKEAALGHIHSGRPDYLAFEAWVRDQTGGGPSREQVEEWNGSIRSRVHQQWKIDDIYPTLGFDGSEGITSAVVLNHLEDWHFWHARDLGGEALEGWRGRTVPLVSSLDYGLLGVCQLPRTWQKLLLQAAGLLHEEYPGLGGGLDRRVVVDVLGLDADQVVEHLTSERPSYLEFEDWVGEQLGGRDVSAAVEEWNGFVRNRVHRADKRADIHSNLGRPDDGSLPQSAVVLNHVEDWHLAHGILWAE